VNRLEAAEQLGPADDTVFIVFEWREEGYTANVGRRELRKTRDKLIILGLYWTEGLARRRIHEEMAKPSGEDWGSAGAHEVPSPPLPIDISSPVAMWRLRRRRKDSYRKFLAIWKVQVFGCAIDRLAAMVEEHNERAT